MFEKQLYSCIIFCVKGVLLNKIENQTKIVISFWIKYSYDKDKLTCYSVSSTQLCMFSVLDTLLKEHKSRGLKKYNLLRDYEYHRW